MSTSALLDLPPSYLEVTYRDCVDTVLDLYLFTIPSELIRETALVRLQRFIPLIKNRLDNVPIHLQDSRWMAEFKEILSAIYEVIPNWPEFRGHRHPRGSSVFGRFDSLSLHVHIGYWSNMPVHRQIEEEQRRIPMIIRRRVEDQRVSLSRYV
jgi:hypothetical protein